MVDLRTTYLGLELSSPLIVASAGITETVERMRRCQEHGAGAVVMKSWFEEEVSRLSPTPRFTVLHHDLLDEASWAQQLLERPLGGLESETVFGEHVVKAHRTLVHGLSPCCRLPW